MEAVRFGTATVLDHKYLNTGGSCMVSVFTIFYRDLGIRYIICNDEGYTEQLIDNVSQENAFDDLVDNFVLGARYWDDVRRTTLTDDAFELYSYCYFEFLKKYCKTFGNFTAVCVEQLPDNLYNSLPAEMRTWHIKNCQELTTDGYEVFPSDYYDPADNDGADSEEFIKVVNFQKDLDNKLSAAVSDDSFTKYYDKPFVLAFDGQYVELPFDAETYGKVEELLDSVIENW